MTDAALSEPPTEAAVFVQSRKLAALAGVRHAFFTRQGGVSTGLYASLNGGLGSNDDPDAVQENRRRMTAALGLSAGRLAVPWQVHSAEATIAAAPWARHEAPHVDAVAGRRSGVADGGRDDFDAELLARSFDASPWATVARHGVVEVCGVPAATGCRRRGADIVLQQRKTRRRGPDHATDVQFVPGSRPAAAQQMTRLDGSAHGDLHEQRRGARDVAADELYARGRCRLSQRIDEFRDPCGFQGRRQAE